MRVEVDAVVQQIKDATAPHPAGGTFTVGEAIRGSLPAPIRDALWEIIAEAAHQAIVSAETRTMWGLFCRKHYERYAATETPKNLRWCRHDGCNDPSTGEAGLTMEAEMQQGNVELGGDNPVKNTEQP